MRQGFVGDLMDKYSIPIRDIICDKSLINRSGDLIADLGFDVCNILLVGDTNVEDVLHKICDSISGCLVSKFILHNPSANQDNILLIEERCKKVDLIVAVGSGTINDLCKVASFKNNIPYVIFATAPSMNGYASANASIFDNGYKKSFLAQQALAIYFDLDILSSAPENLIKAGIGDSLCYWTCHFDWLLSHLVLGTDYNKEVFDILKPYQEKLISFDGDIRSEAFIRLLCEILIISGFAMYVCNGSYPASQGEHLIAHFLELKHPKIMNNSLHGEHISVTALTMIDVQNKFISFEEVRLRSVANIDVQYIKNLICVSEEVAIECVEALRKKRSIDFDLSNVNINFLSLRKELLSVMISKERMLKFYDKFSLPKIPSDLGITDISYKEAVDNSYLIRDRFTALDLIIS
jgi:glycerol-1-phosphate dehydrogenase [NAD(P)+]